MNFEEFFEKLKKIEIPFKRRIFFVAILSKKLEEKNIRPIMVGENALEF